MKCPACGDAMTEMTAGTIRVDACTGGCGGLWFDDLELCKVDQQDQSAGEVLLNIPRNPGVTVDQSRKRRCPRHPGIPMMQHFWSIQRQVTVDECPQCRGVFLDSGELARIRSEYASDEERHKAAHAYYREMFDKQLADMVRQDRSKLARVRRLAHVFRFLCPSYYQSDKQDWGAF